MRGRVTNKFRAKRTVVDGRTFASKKEAARYEELKERQRKGYISELECQRPFVIQEAFLDKRTGKKERAITYICDFFYWSKEEESYLVEDVKGYETDTWKLKRKLFLKKFGDSYKLVITK
jgi:hypothetical protein